MQKFVRMHLLLYSQHICEYIYGLSLYPQVEYGIEYTGNGEIVKITLNATIINTNISTQLLQNHAITFKVTFSANVL